MKYVAIKLRRFPHWLWFKKVRTTRVNGIFYGEDGWGKGGAYTNIKVDVDEIVGEIESEELQYAN